MVVAAGETVSGDVGVPVMPVMEMEVALATDQARVALPPALMVEGEAEKLLIVGAAMTGLPAAALPPPQPFAKKDARPAMRRKAKRARVRCAGIFCPKYEQKDRVRTTRMARR